MKIRHTFLCLLLALCLTLGTVPAFSEQMVPEEFIVYTDSASYAVGASMSVTLELPRAGSADLYVVNDAGDQVAVIMDATQVDAGVTTLTWDCTADGAALPAGTYYVVGDLDDESSEIEFEITGAPAASAASAQPANASLTVAATTYVDTPITPAHLSEVTPDHDPAGCYWCTPMDITDEAAVWAMLTSPVTVLDIAQKSQAILRSAPDENAEGVGMITGASQALHVLETRDDGWSLVECYSSSFHDSTVKAWNAYVTGYIQTKRLTTVTPNQEYGIVIDKLTQRLYLFKDGHLFTELLVSTGLANERQPYNETRSGEFLIVSRVGDFYSDAMTCAMALRFNSGDLLHEVPYVKNADGSKNYKSTEYKLGTRASHGCIRTQRLKNKDGINMTWIWKNISNKTKLVIWEDYQGRQIVPPSDDLTLYYNPDGGSSYHLSAECNGVKDQYLPLAGSFTYGELDDAAYAELDACPYCIPPERKAVLEEINQIHLTTSPGMIEY